MRILRTDTEFDSVRSLLNRRAFLTEEAGEKLQKVRGILESVKAEGDSALVKLTKTFDGVELTPDDLPVGEEEFARAYSAVDDDFLAALRTAKENILSFHRRQLRNSWTAYEDNGIILGQKITPLESVGLYVPGGTGGKTPLVSSVLMNALPALVAGVKRIVITTPPGGDKSVSPHLLVAAQEVGVTEVYKVGGAQAIAALTYGTQRIPRVDKIVGPGNIYVTIAKRLVYGRVGLDMLAGPSEILIVADETASPRLVAADLLSQAEHDPMAGAFLLTPHEPLITGTAAELERQLAELPRKEIAASSLANCGGLIHTRDLAEAVDLANLAAPEHLELLVADPYRWVGMIRHAGAVFLGPSSPEPIGDYVAGTNHVLPTNGTARFASALSVDDFCKKISIVGYTPSGLQKYGPSAVALAEVEGLEAHARAVRIRLKDN